MPIYFKYCKRCGGGDLFIGSDMYGAYLDCLQCGFTPPQLVIDGSNTKKSGISIDAHIGTLLVLDKRGKISAFSPDGLVEDRSLEKRLEAMAQHDYVAVASSNGKTYSPENESYAITPKGREALDAYMEFVKKILEYQKSKKAETKNAKISSYELVDEDGNLTLIGEYAIKASKVLSEFIKAIYPMATIPLESEETVEETEHGEKQPAVLAKLL